MRNIPTLCLHQEVCHVCGVLKRVLVLLVCLQVVYEIPAPGPTARLEMLKYHGRNKPIEDEGLYFKVTP